MSAAVAILFRTPGVVSARVRDASGIFDVAWSRLQPWSCTCLGASDCSHVDAVRRVTS